MSRKQSRRPAPGSKLRPARLPNQPHHNFPAPYSRLLTLGEEENSAAYAEIEAELRKGELETALSTLTGIALDETYYDYYDEKFKEEDPRLWTRLNTLRVLTRFGPQAQPAVEPLLTLLDDDDDYVCEEMPFFYAAVGEGAIEPLARLLDDGAAGSWARIGAGESLAEIGEAHTELRSRIVSLLETALLTEQEDDGFCAYIVTNLLDLGAKESLPIIQQAFQEGRIEESLVQMADVEEHFDLPRLTPRRHWDYEGMGEEEAEEDILALDENTPFGAGDSEDEEDEAPQTPYVAPIKVGRNDPCPCGSGKKFKKCHGA